MRNDAAAVRKLRTVVRAHGGAEAATNLPSIGTLLGAGHAAPTGASVAGPAIALAGEVRVPGRRHLDFLLCLVCLRYACRLHGALDGGPQCWSVMLNAAVSPPAVKSKIQETRY